MATIDDIHEECTEAAFNGFFSSMADIDFEGELMENWKNFSKNLPDDSFQQEHINAWRYAVKQAIELYEQRSREAIDKYLSAHLDEL